MKPPTEQLLEAVSSVRLRDSQRESNAIQRINPADDLAILRSGPSLEQLDAVLVRLSEDKIHGPTPESTQLVHVLVGNIVPSFWPQLQHSRQRTRHNLLFCLQSLLGYSCILQALKHEETALSTWIDVLQQLLGQLSILEMWQSQKRSATSRNQFLASWCETVNLFGSSKIVSIVAELETKKINTKSWMSDGQRYTEWVGKNIRDMVRNVPSNVWDQEAKKDFIRLVVKSLTIGYRAFLPLLTEPYTKRVQDLLRIATESDQRTIIYALIGQESQDLTALVEGEPSLGLHLSHWLSDVPLQAAQYPHEIHCQVIRNLSVDLDRTKDTFARCLATFGDKLSIKHTPVLQQEINTQILLLLAAQICRCDGDFLKQVSQSSVYLNAISNHLAASSPRSRYLGMVIGRCVSEKVDPPGKRLDFQPEDDWEWYRSLLDPSKPSKTMSMSPSPSAKIQEIVSEDDLPIFAPSSAKIQDIVSQDDLPVYAKPDSAPVDDDDDPELVSRQKPSAPVDLLAGIRESENFNVHRLALIEAPMLIRRKAHFGSELLDHADGLAAALLGLDDRWEMDDFADLKIQAMIALVVAAPQPMGKYYAQSFYGGDYALGQRVAILTAMGLGAREISDHSQPPTFPSKQLPNKLHALFSSEREPLEIASSALESSILQPLALEAADRMSGPDILKVRTFSSRMEVQRRRPKPTANTLAKIVAESFLLPLIGRWQIQINHMGRNAPQGSPMLLSHMLKTLAIILHAAGPSTQGLLQLSQELWAFFFSIRTGISGHDPLVLEALLLALLSLLEVNLDHERTLAEQQGSAIVETQAWMGQLLEQMPGQDQESKRCQMLAAAILLRCNSVIEKHQRILMGELALVSGR